MRFITLLFGIGYVCSNTVYSQQEGLLQPDREWAVSGAISVQHHTMLELSMVRTSLPHPKFDVPHDGQYVMRFMAFGYNSFGGCLLLRDDNVEFAPKVDVGVNLLIGNINISVVGYNDDFQSFYPAILPEAGLTLFGFASITYGYNFFLQEDHPYVHNRHRVTLRYTHFYSSWKL